MCIYMYIYVPILEVNVNRNCERYIFESSADIDIRKDKNTNNIAQYRLTFFAMIPQMWTLNTWGKDM